MRNEKENPDSIFKPFFNENKVARRRSKLIMLICPTPMLVRAGIKKKTRIIAVSF
jgi:hypothetical protein